MTTQAALLIAASAYQRILLRAEGLGIEVRERPTRLAGWTVTDLLDHVTWGAAMEASALRGHAHGRAEGHQDQGALRRAVASFETAIRLRPDPEAVVSLPTGTIPLSHAAPLFAFEAALHASDLEHALGHAAALTTPEIECCAQIIGPMLDLVARPAATGSRTIDIIGIGTGLRLVGTPGAWHRTAPDSSAATTTISGSAQDLVLFVCGRIAFDAGSLRVEGDVESARRFKEFFPGP